MQQQNEFDELEKSFICPISLAIMLEPVMDNEGNTWEKTEIEKVCDATGKSPKTRNSIKKVDLRPNRALKDIIDDYLSKNPHRKKEQYKIDTLFKDIVDAITKQDVAKLRDLIHEKIDENKQWHKDEINAIFDAAYGADNKSILKCLLTVFEKEVCEYFLQKRKPSFWHFVTRFRGDQDVLHDLVEVPKTTNDAITLLLSTPQTDSPATLFYFLLKADVDTLKIIFKKLGSTLFTILESKLIKNPDLTYFEVLAYNQNYQAILVDLLLEFPDFVFILQKYMKSKYDLDETHPEHPLILKVNSNQITQPMTSVGPSPSPAPRPPQSLGTRQATPAPIPATVATSSTPSQNNNTGNLRPQTQQSHTIISGTWMTPHGVFAPGPPRPISTTVLRASVPSLTYSQYTLAPNNTNAGNVPAVPPGNNFQTAPTVNTSSVLQVNDPVDELLRECGSEPYSQQQTQTITTVPNNYVPQTVEVFVDQVNQEAISNNNTQQQRRRADANHDDDNSNKYQRTR